MKLRERCSCGAEIDLEFEFRRNATADETEGEVARNTVRDFLKRHRACQKLETKLTHHEYTVAADGTLERKEVPDEPS